MCFKFTKWHFQVWFTVLLPRCCNTLSFLVIWASKAMIYNRYNELITHLVAVLLRNLLLTHHHHIPVTWPRKIAPHSQAAMGPNTFWIRVLKASGYLIPTSASRQGVPGSNTIAARKSCEVYPGLGFFNLSGILTQPHVDPKIAPHSHAAMGPNIFWIRVFLQFHELF